MKTYAYCCLLLLLSTVASTTNAEPVTANRPKVTANSPSVVAESNSRTTIFQKCAEVEPDASYQIPKQFGGRTEASGTGAYGYQPAADCAYWVVDFLLNRYSHTWITEAGMTIREYVLFTGDAFDLPSSSGEGRRPIVEEDCKRLEVDLLIYRRDPNESTFKMVKTGSGRFASWNNTNKICSLQGMPELYSERAPTANMLKVRIAVRVKLRGSWQQAAGYASVAPPN